MLRTRLDQAGRRYVLSVSAETTVFTPETVFQAPELRESGKGRQPKRPRPDRDPEAIGALIARQHPDAWQTVTFRDGPSYT